MGRAGSAQSMLVILATLLTTTSALKCCPPGHILTSDLTCLLGTSHYLLYDSEVRADLNCSSGFTIVQPTTDVRVDCLDVMMDEQNKTSLVGLVCEDSETYFVPEVSSVRKCCPPNKRYSDFREGCWGENSLDDSSVEKLRLMFLKNSTSAVNLEIGKPKCAKGSVLSDLLLHHRHVWRQDSESIVLKHQGPSDILLVPEEFCVDVVTADNYSLVVRACQDARVICDLQQRPCINKCCREGSSYQGFSCVDSKLKFDVQFYKLHPHRTPTYEHVDSVGLAYENQFFSCKNGRYKLDPMATTNDISFVTDKGLYIPANPIDQKLIPWRKYCVEYFEGVVVPFICFPEPRELKHSMEELHFKLIAYGLMLSSMFLLVTLLVYALLPTLHNLHGLTLMCHVASLLLAYSFLVSSQLLSNIIPQVYCTAISYGIQFFFLAAFSWLNIICFDIWWTFGAIKAHVAKREESRRRFCWYSLYAWLLPLTITVTTFTVDSLRLVPDLFLPHMAVRFCFFFRGSHGKTLFFNLPIMLQITSNVIFFALTIRNCSKIKSELRQMQNNSNAKLKYHADINKLAMNTKLFVVMGITWLCEVITWYFQGDNTDYWWYVLDAANIFQGVFIFFIFVIKKKVVRAMKLRIHEKIPSWFQTAPKHRPSSSTIFTTVTSSDGRFSSQIKK